MLRGGSTRSKGRPKGTMLPATFSCPRCKCPALYLARPSGLDRLMSVVGLSPARCMTCGKRFYLRSSQVKNYISKPAKRTWAYSESAESHGAESDRAA